MDGYDDLGIAGDDINNGSETEMRGDRVEIDELKCEMLREKLLNAKKLGEMFDNANRFLCTAIGFMENFGEKIGLHLKCQKNENTEKLINGEVHDI